MLNRLKEVIEMASAMVEDATFEDDQLANMTTDDVVRASRLLDNEIRILKVQLSSFCFAFSISVTLTLSIPLLVCFVRFHLSVRVSGV